MSEPVVPAAPLSLEKLAGINIEQDKDGNKARLKELGDIEGVMKSLGVDPLKGLTSEQVTSMRAWYGTNAFPESPMTSFLELFIGSFEDPVLLILCAAALVSLLTSGLLHHEWLEGIAIFIAVFLVATIDSAQNYSKELKFRALEASASNDERCSVLRNNEIERINPIDLVVGDIVILQAGEMIPADAVVIDDTECKANEAALTGEPDDLKKTKKNDCFLLSSCLITEAEETRAMVMGIGFTSQWGKIKANLMSESVNTPLQDKLEEMTNLIGYVGMAAALGTFVVLFIRALVVPHEKEVWEQMLDALIIAITIVVVAIPEGLPLAVTIALAYSTNKMYEDQNLIRVLSACETMGNATNICSDKTGTLTENLMTVVTGTFADTKYSQDSFGTLTSNPPAHVKEFIGMHSVINRIAYLVYKDEDGKPLHRPNCIGNKTEGALITMAKGWGFDEEKTKAEAYLEGRDKIYAFNSSKKRSTCIITLPDGRVRVFCKGATEWMMKDCTKILDSSGKEAPLDAAKRADLDKYILEMADQALRTLCLTHRDFPNMAALPDDWKENPPDDKELVMDCIVGIIDPLRSDVKEAVRIAQRAGVTVRMVTGDNIATAKAIARQCGILTEDGDAVEGPVFRNMTPAAVDALLPRLQVMGRSSPDDKYLLVTRLNGYGLPKDQAEWEEKHKAKSGVSYEKDKDTLLPGYKEEWDATRPEGGEVVGVTGDGTNDAPALKAADVGLSMGITGTKVAQGASDIVILDDKFSSIVKAIMWGRNVYDNIRKFLQFQLTVNVVALLTVFIAACAGKAPPLNAVQMLWVNLIMDTLGALALATEPPTDALLDRMPYKRSAALVSKPMWRNIMCQSVYQTILIMVLMFAGEKMFDVKPHEWCRDWGLLDSPSSNTFDASGTAMTCAEVHSQVNNNCSDDLNGECYEELVFDNSDTFGSDRHDFSEDCLECNLHDYHHATIMFNAFIFCQFFNEYTARSIGDEWNCFKGLMLNPVFLFVSVFTLLIQIVLIVFCGDYIGTMPYPGISLNEWLITVALGALSLPVGVMMRFIPMQEDPNDFFQSGASMRKAKTIDLYPDAKEEAAKVASQ